ncbi:unnamed protein product [Penicillium salamii]|uniref:Yeast cell wall synthesis Kre9/Knh1 C-terminal domain-containing protein n=1 Tax=Penicillium salamii TaxID=1612424 RepID=A0A9W4NKU6_9EURO|nr:unnamed protein product [Penicillium salamii]CAG8190111.1 unnamed protein product [Penicillium salamii]CAG8286686.1 unnamed protein product [Penicillium salamii]CAG8298535.1 unnamed protein product [Penicillium salamii]CAG8374422.1 unnamed protein product [Penicillium salamii]
MRTQWLSVASFVWTAYGQAVSPVSSLTFDGAGAVSLFWGMDSAPTSRYDFYLCAGDETTDKYESLSQVIKNGVYAAGDMVTFAVDQNMGGNDPDAYFLKIVLSDPYDYWSGFTSHFTLTNMTGSFSEKVTTALKTMEPRPAIMASWPPIDEDRLLEAEEVASAFNITNSPSTSAEKVLQFPTPTARSGIEHELRKRQVAAAGVAAAAAPAAAAVAVDQHTVPYGDQTGLTKYAPMPKKAGSTIATRSATPQYPPFPFDIATAYLSAATVQYTEMAYATWTANTIENTAPAAPTPTLDKRMQKWLDRWKD